jgi:hypothetical protein
MPEGMGVFAHTSLNDIGYKHHKYLINYMLHVVQMLKN